MKKLGNFSPFRSTSPSTTLSDSDDSAAGSNSTTAKKPSQLPGPIEHKVNVETASRPELARYVQVLTDQSSTYERRFKDVVRAYKRLQTERDALESSLKASLVQRSQSKAQSVEERAEDPESEGEAATDEVSVLTQAVATLTEEKSRIESSYQEDKKQSLQEHQSQRRALAESLEQAESDLGDLLKERQTLKEDAAHLRMENSELSREVKGLEERTGELERCERERREKETARNESEESRYLPQILSLQRRVEEANESSRASELKAEEMERVRGEERLALGEQEQKMIRLESELKQVNSRRHETAAVLESRVSELSAMVGESQERSRRQQEEIAELNQRLLQRRESSDRQEGSDPLEAVIKLSEQEVRLRSTLQTVLKSAAGGRVGVEEACEMSTSELLGALAREKSAASPQTDSEKLCEEYQRRLEEMEAQVERGEVELKGEIARERENARERTAELGRVGERREAENRSKLGAMESQLLKLREHTSALLADKDEEICRLRNRIPGLESVPSRDQQPTDSAVSQFITTSGYYSDNNSSVHLSQVKQRQRDKQRAAGAKIEELESALRDTESRELKHLEQLSFLQNEILRLDNCLGRQGTNLEYVKNVVLQFVLGGSGKRRDLSVPLSAVLRLSPEESRLLSQAL